MTRITIIDGHPDPAEGRFIHSLADAYESGARAAGHHIRRISIARLVFPLVRTQSEWEHGVVPPDIEQAQAAITEAEHLVILYPLWLGDMPALLKAFLEQVARPTFAFRYREKGFPEKLLRGRSARIIVTMGMPAILYRLVYRSHSLKSLERNILGFTGVKPIRHIIIGSIAHQRQRVRWLKRVEALGRRGA